MSERTLIADSAEVQVAPRLAGAAAERIALVALFSVFAVVWFASLGWRSLIHADEGRYATLALEMARSGDWVTPRLNGLLYFEKPALQYWIGALSFHWFGITEFAARLWPGLSGFLTIAVTGFTAQRLWGRDAGLRAFAIAGSTTWIIGNSHFLTLDAGLTLFLTLTLCAVLLAECTALDPAMRRRWLWLGWAAMAGAVLSKGLVGVVIPGGTLVLASLWLRDYALWRRLHIVSGSVIFLALAAPWFILVSYRNPGFAEFFFIHEHFARYFTNVHHRPGAWWYYLPHLFFGSLPWISGLPWAIQLPWKLSHRSDAAAADGRASVLLVTWAAFIFLFFSVSGSKLPSYILPLFPALALLLTLRLRSAAVAPLRWHLLVPAIIWIVALVATTQAHRLIKPEMPQEVVDVFVTAIRSGAVLFLVGAATAWWLLSHRRITAAVLGVAMAHFLAMTIVMQAHDAYGQQKSAAPIARALLPLIKPDTPVFAVGSYDQTLPFYLGRDIVLVDYVDEFALGQRLEPARSIATVDEFLARWKSLPQGAAYMNLAFWEWLQQRGMPMRVVFKDARRVVVMKP